MPEGLTYSMDLQSEGTELFTLADGNIVSNFMRTFLLGYSKLRQTIISVFVLIDFVFLSDDI